jgi:hypothetical protein
MNPGDEIHHNLTTHSQHLNTGHANIRTIQNLDKFVSGFQMVGQFVLTM